MRLLSMLFPSATLAERLESAETSLVVEFARAAERRRPTDVYISQFGGGAAVLAGPTSPFNKMAGLGFAPLDETALAEAEREFAARSIPLRAEVSTLGNPEIFALLASRGYVLSGFENVLGLDLGNPEHLPRPAPSVAVRRIGDDETQAWIRIVVTGFLHPDAFDGPPPTESFDRGPLEGVFNDTQSITGMTKYIATLDGIVAGGASMRITGGVAQLSGASTLPEHRRRGVQTSLLAVRLREAAGSCDVAVVTTEPGSKSQENVQRQGFELLYARAVMVKAAP
jgi:ribosomal protein S18 acetylase RimI-like enzyme